MRILVAEDNETLAEGLAAVLRNGGYAVDVVQDGASADAALRATDFDLVVLDLNLPEMDGLDVLRALRARRSGTAVLILTARGAMDQRVKGLDLGADDYMTKPFDVPELEARVRVLLRRRSGLHDARISFGEITLDTVSRSVTARGATLDVPQRELHVLETLLMKAGQVVAKQAIIESLAAFDDDLSPNAVEQYVSRLRRRLAPFDVTVRTARGLGYYLDRVEELMRRGYSLRRRLLAWLLVALLAVAGIAVADSWREASETATSVSDRVLAGSILAIAERVIVTEDGTLEVDVPYVALEMLTSAAQDRVFYRVDGPDGFITGYQTLPAVPGAGSEIVYADDMFRGDAIRVGSLQRAASSGVSAIPFTVSVAETTIARSQLAQSLLVRVSLRLVLLIAVAGVIVWFAVSLSLLPLYRLRTAIEQRSSSDLSPIRQAVPREVEGLVETVNSFMQRLGAALGALRHFTGNASHQLRTPMAIVRTQLALARRAETPAARVAALGIADDAIGHAERFLAQLLVLARIDEAASDRPAAPPLDVAALARERTSDYVPRANAAGIDLGYEGADSAMLAADPMLLGELLTNLLDNVLAYAGRGAEATVRVGVEGDGVVLEVADSGAGVPPERLPQVLQRFGRESRDTRGAGLGLSIVEEIAQLFGGAMAVSSAVGAGFRVTVRFPAQAGWHGASSAMSLAKAGAS